MVRDYRPSDEQPWLLCRALAFLGTDYYDDVKRNKTALASTDLEYVAIVGDRAVGLLDVEVAGLAATIDTIAVHPEHQRQGIADQLLAHALVALRRRKVETLDAWTREDATAMGWYQRAGFVEQFRYLHFYADDLPAHDGHPIVHALLHASIDEEAAIRSAHDRVYVCRQYLRAV